MTGAQSDRSFCTNPSRFLCGMASTSSVNRPRTRVFNLLLSLLLFFSCALGRGTAPPACSLAGAWFWSSGGPTANFTFVPSNFPGAYR